MRVARIVLIVVVVLGALFVVADRVTVHLAETKAAKQAQITEDLSTRPKVSIEGFPFLTQAVFGKLDDVKVTARDIAASDSGGSVRIDSFHADLHGVKLSNGYSRAVADSADGNAFLTFDDLTKAAPDGITVSYAGAAADGATLVKLSGSVPGIGSKIGVLSEITVRGADSIGLHAQPLPKAFTALGLDDQIRQRIDFTLRLSHLPEGIALTSITAAPDGITVAAGGHHVVLAG